MCTDVRISRRNIRTRRPLPGDNVSTAGGERSGHDPIEQTQGAAQSAAVERLPRRVRRALHEFRGLLRRNPSVAPDDVRLAV